MAYLDKAGLEHLVNKIKARVIPISKGGTGATTADGAREKLGLKYIGVAASARGSTNSLSLSATVKTTVPLNTWISRTDTAFEFSDNGIKVPYTGVVQVTGSVYLSGAPNSSGTGCYIIKNGAEVTAQYLIGASGGVSSGAIIVPVSAGDVLKLVARMSVAGNCAPNNTSTSLSIEYIK